MICSRYVSAAVTTVQQFTNMSPAASIHVDVRPSFQSCPSCESCAHQSSPGEGPKGRLVDDIPIYLSVPLSRPFPLLYYTPMSPCQLSRLLSTYYHRRAAISFHVYHLPRFRCRWFLHGTCLMLFTPRSATLFYSRCHGIPSALRYHALCDSLSFYESEMLVQYVL